MNLWDNYGMFVLKEEVMKGNREMTLKLLQRGADIENWDEFEWTPLHIAMNLYWQGFNDSIIKVLLDNHASLNVVDMKGRTPLHYLFIKANKRDRSEDWDPVEIIAMICEWEF